VPFHQTSLYLRVSRYHFGQGGSSVLNGFVLPLCFLTMPQINGLGKHLTSTTRNLLYLKVHQLSLVITFLSSNASGHADLNSSPSTPTPKKSSNAGVILACVFIGLLVIALAFVSSCFTNVETHVNLKNFHEPSQILKS
jgi:hypothetical protein